jgi:hypothetical protein
MTFTAGSSEPKREQASPVPRPDQSYSDFDRSSFISFSILYKSHYALPLVPTTIMPAIASKAAGRAVLRRSHQFQRHSTIPIPKRYSHTNPATPRSNVSENPTTETSVPVPNTVATLPLWQRLGPLSRAFEAYARSQRKRPYVTQFYSSLAIYSLGDMSAQSISGLEYDPLRTLRSLAIGAGSSIPSYKWYRCCCILGQEFTDTDGIGSCS